MHSLAGVAWYSCNLSPAAPFLPASLLSNEMQRVKKLGLCVRKCAGFVLLSSSQEAGGRGEGRGREWRKQTDGLPAVLPAGWAIFGGEHFLPLSPCCPEVPVGKTQSLWELPWAWRMGNALLFFRQGSRTEAGA